ncbi:leucine-rich repeat receptor protein kinase HPCA1-like [Gastrolobium bilobum]|uniref:leucine-rich repeat receptor protein kinase HPCA1-like n=1 Tax=Gastrolobium bilobum TaxID=150636 RepID=UPI002AAF1EA4|nr:leucine-rich repeat receptor protein kinase HPCA1-like [Gastrolobium bilobum]
MGERILVPLVLLFNFLLSAVAQDVTNDFRALESLRDSWQSTTPSWVGSDPCNGWDGIKCKNSRVISISLPGTGLTGQLSGDIGSLSELETLDLSYNRDLTGPLPQEIGNLKKLSKLILVGCGFTGPIPDEIGSLQQLVFLSLNSNYFVGPIPPSIGNLSNLIWLDLTDNQLDGSIPVSSRSTPGLDMLLTTKHFHLGKNKLSGEIPSQLFSSKMTLIHVIFESNQLIGSIPETLGLVKSLVVVRLEKNSLDGYVPQNLNNLTNVTDLLLSNNKLQGSLPNLTGMNSLEYLDLSNNNFDPSGFPPWLSNMKNLRTLLMESVNLYGKIPVPLFSLAYLENVVLKSNKLDGTLDIGTNYSKQLQLIDLQSNSIEDFKQQNEFPNITIILVYNPICDETGATGTYCTKQNTLDTKQQKNCLADICSSNQILSPKCKCAYPYTGTLTFRSPSLFAWRNKSSLEEDLFHAFQSLHLPVDSVSLIIPPEDPFQSFEFIIQIFPLGQDHFNQQEISSISSLLGNLSTNRPYTFVTENQGPKESSNSSNIALIIVAAIGGSSFLLVLLLAGVYAFRQKRRAERAISLSNPFGNWDPNKSNCGIPQLKATRQFSFKELKKYTNNFSQANDIGSGGYGKVYRGTLPCGQLIAIKRAQKGSKQGVLEFKAEIELLSRVHHKNVVSLVGFCFEREEQMLVYEFVPNGTLKDFISGTSGYVLGWSRRLKVALGAAWGLAYLHGHANPPIIHRDIKSNNILLDENFNAKVADFGLSKSILDCEKDHVTTQVKGTMGYLDPDYYSSQQLTEKSDVYSFGVIMLELITAKKPIERGKYIVKVVRNAIDKTKDFYGLHELIDPTIGSGSTMKGFEKFVDLAMKCVEESGADRPTMSDVVKEIEDMLQSAGLNSTSEPEVSTSSIYKCYEVSMGSPHHPYSNESFDSSTEHLHPKNEPS